MNTDWSMCVQNISDYSYSDYSYKKWNVLLYKFRELSKVLFASISQYLQYKRWLYSCTENEIILVKYQIDHFSIFEQQ